VHDVEPVEQHRYDDTLAKHGHHLDRQLRCVALQVDVAAREFIVLERNVNV